MGPMGPWGVFIPLVRVRRVRGPTRDTVCMCMYGGYAQASRWLVYAFDKIGVSLCVELHGICCTGQWWTGISYTE